MGQICLRDAKSLAAFRSRSEMRCKSLGLWPLVLPSLRRDQDTRPQVPLSPWSWDGFSSISAAMPSPTGLSDEFLAFASLSIRSAEPGIQKAGPLDSGGFEHLPFFGVQTEKASMQSASPIAKAIMWSAGVTSSAV